MSDTALPRVMGLETEYALISGNGLNSILGTRGFNEEFFMELFPKSPYIVENYSNAFLYNGARFYIDNGEHPEYATPECQSVSSLLAYEKAGQKMLEQAEIFINACIKNSDLPSEALNRPKHFDYLRSRFRDRLHKRFYPVRIFRNNLCPEIDPKMKENISWGCHENYLMDANINYERIQNFLTPFLISRQIFGGAGWLNLYSNKSVAFLLAQRPLVTHMNIGGGTTGMRPIINTRNEPWADADKHKRLHLILGDTNMSLWPAFLKIKTTAMMLDILEDREFSNGIDFSDMIDPVGVFKEFSEDLWFAKKFGAGGKIHTALSLQRLHLELAQRFYLIEQRKAVDEETKNALELWQLVLDTIEAGEFALLAPYFDNFAKLYIFDSILAESGVELKNPSARKLKLGTDINYELYNRLKEIDLKYHRVYEKESAYHIFQKSKICHELKQKLCERLPFLKKEIVAAEDIETAMIIPPPGRARWRRRIMELAEKQDKTNYVKNLSLNWNNGRIKYYKDDRETIFGNNNDPYCEMTDDLKRELDSCGNP